MIEKIQESISEKPRKVLECADFGEFFEKISRELESILGFVENKFSLMIKGESLTKIKYCARASSSFANFIQIGRANEKFGKTDLDKQKMYQNMKHLSESGVDLIKIFVGIMKEPTNLVRHETSYKQITEKIKEQVTWFLNFLNNHCDLTKM